MSMVVWMVKFGGFMEWNGSLSFFGPISCFAAKRAGIIRRMAEFTRIN